MRLARVVLGLTALVFFVMAVALLVRPQLAALVDLPPSTPTARVELAAMYSGLELGVAAFLALCAFRGADRLRPGLLLGGLALGGLGAVRLGTTLVVGPVVPLMYWFALAEIAGAALCFWAARQAPAPPAPDSQPASGDLRPEELGSLSWGEGQREGSLKTVYEHVTCSAYTAIGWYLQAKRGKKRMARFTRFSAILAVAGAALLPLLAQIQASETRGAAGRPSEWWTHPAWASVLLAVAAALIGMDRFFGFSTSWIRYIDADMQLRQTVEEFELDWQKARAALPGGTLTPEATAQLLAACRAFTTQVNSIVRGETAVWIQEFQSNLRQVDESVQARAAESQPPAVTVLVTNGEESTGGWILSVDGRQQDAYQGRSAAVTRLLPGPHSFQVTGRIGDKAVQAEVAAILKAGEEKKIELTLE